MKKFLDFIKGSPTAYHACENVKNKLRENGFIELREKDKWELKEGKYFFDRNMSSIFAFVIPKGEVQAFSITAAHLDSPTFKLKPNFYIDKGRYIKFNTEVYGGPIFSSWMDRPLGVAGRVFYETNDGISSKLVNINKPICMIPNLPIHYNRKINSGYEFNPQIDLLPLFCDNSIEKKSLYSLIASELKIEEDKILSSDLYLTNLDRGCLVGPNEEFVMAPQIDNLECSYALIEALINANSENNINVCVLFDNEEIGSSTMQGACGTLLEDNLRRISYNLGFDEEKHLQIISNSFIVSADNAQGFHPNFPGKYDETNACYLNSGVVIKNAARGSYSTDGYSSAYFQKICKEVNVPYQLNTNRSDVPGGSTLGALSVRHVSIPSVDIGLAQLAMHSAYETAGSKDLELLIKAITNYYKK